MLFLAAIPRPCRQTRQERAGNAGRTTTTDGRPERAESGRG